MAESRQFVRRPGPTAYNTKAQRLLASVTMVVLAAVGALFVLVALIVFLTQGQQIRVTARVLSESCRPQYDVGDATTYTRCDAAVEFGDASGS
jgi:hypothetical protein